MKETRLPRLRECILILNLASMLAAGYKVAENRDAVCALALGGRGSRSRSRERRWMGYVDPWVDIWCLPVCFAKQDWK